MNNSYRYFTNKECEYFPCHHKNGDFNCLFCYCPLYRIENCPGNPKYLEKDGGRLKVCTECTFPHQPQNYDTIIKILKDNC